MWAALIAVVRGLFGGMGKRVLLGMGLGLHLALRHWLSLTIT